MMAVGAALAAAGAAAGQDWSEWRGPARNGVIRSAAPLLEALAAEGLELLWELALPPSGKPPYYASPVGAAGKAYLHLSPPYVAPPAPPAPPAPAPAVKPLGLKHPPAAGDELDVDALLDPPKPKEAKPAPAVKKPAPGGLDDVLLCVDLRTGKELWRFRQPGGASKLGAPNTPCVRGGKVYFIGNAGTLYCLDAETGKEAWRAGAGGGRHGTFSSSAFVVDDKVIVADRQIAAFGVGDGGKAWEAAVAVSHGSPAVWRHGGRSYLITGGVEIACVRAADGKVVWRVEGNKSSASPVVSGDMLVMMFTYGNPFIYRLSLTGAEKVAEFAIKPAGLGHQSCTPAVDGTRVYAWDSRKSFCYDLAKQAMVWEGEAPGDGKPSPIVADGKVIGNSRRRVLVLDAASGKTLLSAPAAVGSCTSCALVDGRLLVNSGSHLRCYRLAKP